MDWFRRDRFGLGGAVGMIIVCCAVAGCAGRQASPLPPGNPRLTAHPAPEVPGRRVSTLLDFELPLDLAFVSAAPSGAARIDRSAARSGAGSLLLPPETDQVIFKLPALLEGRAFPAEWTLLGAYLRSDEPVLVTLVYQPRQLNLTRTVALVPGAWTPVMIDLAPLGGSSAMGGGAAPISFQFDASRRGKIHVDDLMLIDNHETVIHATGGGGAWSVKRRGLNYMVASQHFSLALPTAHAQQGGWSVVEASPARVRFASSAPPGSMTIYPDGRMCWGGEFGPAWTGLADSGALAAQHASPGEVSVPAAMGRVNRSSPGDENNDGYNEARGAYQLIASGGRIEVTIAPREAALVRPVLEIVGLPPGAPRVTMEGKLLEDVVRLEEGTVLVELPGRLQRPTLLNVRVR